MKNIILANADVYSGNRGCAALAITVMSIINKVFHDADEEYCLFLTDCNAPQKGECLYSADGIQTLNFVPCAQFPTNIKSVIKSIVRNRKLGIKVFRNADYILDIGQGDSFADIYGKQRFEIIDNIHKTARLFGKPYCLLPQTIGPFKDEKIRKKAIKSIEGATMVMARDRQSYDYVKENAPAQKNIREYIDVAFYMPYKRIEFSKDSIHVGINISSLLWHGGYSRDNQFGLKVDYQQIVKSLIDYFLSLPNVTLHLIGHVVGAERHIENDYAVNYDIWKEHGNNPRLVLAPLALTPVDVKGYIAGMDFFMGARMHATIGAFSSGVPVVPMAYSRKFNGLFVDTLQYPYLADLKTASETEVIETIKEAFENRDKLKSIIAERMSGVVKEREKMLLDDLKKFFGL